MLLRSLVLSLLSCALFAAQSWVLIRTVDGTRIEGQTDLSGFSFEQEGKSSKVPIAEILSIHSGAPASSFETERTTADLAAIVGTDRAARDQAVEELTAIGLPVITPLLKTLKDTDQHEPRPLYRLFERIIPSNADGVDRTLSLVRLQSGAGLRGKLPQTSLKVRKSDGTTTDVPWPTIRTLAQRRKVVKRTIPVHSLSHCVQIEYLDTGVSLNEASKLNLSTQGFVRLSWNEDGWATDANGLTKPGSPSYKTNLVNGHPFGALVGRVGAKGEIFAAGKSFSKSGLAPGRLQLAVNDNGHWQNNVGTYTVTLTATDAYDLGNAQ